MTIRSMDMQVLVQKVNEVTRIQHSQQQEQMNRQQDLASQINQQTIRNSKSVSAPLKNESKIVHEKEEKEKESRKKNKNKQKPEKEKDGTQNESGSSHKIDFMI
ncbi:MAG: hypothetical protein U9N81_01885 [Bacillota bacterium]|nr:hypothetical protein [Bacillota bacterium]